MDVTGTCHVLFAYDIGFAIDLNRAAARIREARPAAGFRHPRRAPGGEEGRTTPLRLTQRAAPISLGDARTGNAVELVLFDFGGAGVAYEIDIRGSLESLVRLSADLYENDALLGDSRRRMADILAMLGDAVENPELSAVFEDYAVFALLPPEGGAEALLDSHADTIARILGGESEALSAEEVADALDRRFSYRPGEVSVIDWHAAILIGEDTEDERIVLEHANHELTQLRLLDRLLRRAVDAAHEEIARRRGWLAGLALRSETLRRLVRSQADFAILFEGVHNPLALTGDQYLARIYRGVSERFRLREWDQGIGRKLGILESIGDKLTGLATTRRLELLEWLIIVLCALSVVVYFLP